MSGKMSNNPGTQHTYRTTQLGGTAMVRTWSGAVVLLLKNALSMLAKLKARLAGEPCLGTGVVSGAW